MKRNLYFFFISLFVFSNVFAQVQFADTKGELTVNGMGAANYKVPIALPPGIKDVAPQVALTYSSSGNNGIAGYGWNIVGISSITRTSTRIDVDGYVDGVDFDANDQFALDGQRLIISQLQGDPSGSTILFTENYSNLKIRATGTATYPGASGAGPEKFSITFPDGTQAFYGSTSNSRGVSEWLIDKWIDPQGNTIKYVYEREDNINVTYIKKIIWSENENLSTNNYKNEIEFFYKTRLRWEKAYLHGVKLLNTKLLDYIDVRTGGELFRKYKLFHTPNQLGYESVIKIQESNGNNELANPIIYNYEISEDDVTNSEYLFTEENINLNDFKPNVTGDLDGDSYIDAIVEGKLFRNHLTPEGEGNSIVSNVNISTSKLANATAIVLDNGKLNQYQSVVLQDFSQSYGTMPEYPNLEADHKIYLKPQRLDLNNSQFSEIYTRTVKYPYLNKQTSSDGCALNNGNNPEFERFTGEGDKKYIEGDFNGDGISEFIIAGKVQWIDYSIDIYPNGESSNGSGNGSRDWPVDCNAHYHTTEVPKYYVDLNVNIPDENASKVISGMSFKYDDFTFIIDFNGDGKSDLFTINDFGHYSIYSLNGQTNNFERILFGTVNEYKKSNNTDFVLPGDYNGDGKTDLLFPTGVQNTTWKSYQSTGVSFEITDLSIVNFEKEASGHTYNYVYNYFALDIDKDGKSDFLKVMRGQERANTSSGWRRFVHSVRSYRNIGSPAFAFYHDTGLSTTYDNNFIPVPLASSSRNSKSNFDLIMLRKVKITDPLSMYYNRIFSTMKFYNFTKDQSADMRLKSVSEVNGNILSELTYSSLEPNIANGGWGDFNGNYYSSNEELYPFVEIKRLPHVKVVSKLKVSAMGKSKEREFKYFGLTAHSHGLGILGLKIMAQSSWVTSGIDAKIWQVNHTAPSLRGAPIGGWSFSGNNLSLITNPVDNQLLSRSGINYFTQTLTQNRYVQLPELQWQTDFLTGVTSTDLSAYDNYYNLKKSTVQKGGTYITDYTYANNAAGTGVNYYIGRLTKKGTIAYAYGDERTSEEKYTYTGNQLTKVETKGHNTDYITETIQYDGFGNVTQKTTSAPGVSSRTIKDDYDPEGRFVTKKTDVDGLITNLTYNKLGQVLTHTNPFNVITTSTYDHWGKLTWVEIKGASEAYLNTNYTYNRNANGSWDVLSNCSETKAYSKTYYDVLGREIKNRVKGFASNTYITKKTDYDFLGRITQTSEPYFDNSETSNPSQWNTVTYDNLSRPIKQTAFTGKSTSISYNGLSATTTENGKTKTVTKDAAGNVISVSDNGQVMNYNYYANNELKSTTYGNHTISIGIDGWGRKISLLDPSVSSTAYTYDYNNYGELLEETTPNGTTNYSYSPTGKLDTKEIVGDNTDISVTYNYTNKGLLEFEYGTSNGESLSFVYEYDSLYRLKKKTESTGLPLKLTIVKEFIYDHYSRISEEWTNTSVWSTMTTNLTSSVSVKNLYNDYNGILEHITDKTSGATIWKITGANQRMQTLSAQLGNGVNITNTYTPLGYVNTINHTKTGLTAPLSLSYTFDAAKGTLTNRTNSYYSYTENFTYDNFDRLLSWTTPTGVETNTYEGDGRIKTNTNVGTYAYNSGTRYKKSSVALNNPGKAYYETRQLQQVTYNAFKKPVLISEQGRGSIEFKYGITGVRNKAIEWITDTPNTGANKLFRTKLYSSDGSVEIILKGGVNDFSTQNSPFARIITYIGGNAYSAPAMFVTDYQTATTKSQGYHYLHRDFQGSIMAISNATTVLERRHYDAWGNVSRFGGATNPNLVGGEFFFDRGYTGHEHFFRVGIIHMNGRIYDPVLKGFMSPDNFVQDPQNSQNFNRYAYCYNNPLMHTDPSGEWVVLGSELVGAAIIGAIIGAASYGLISIINDTPVSFHGFAKSAIFGFLGGAASFGVGELASQMFTGICNTTSTLTFNQVKLISGVSQAAMHGTSQGFIAGISGGDFGQSFINGMISSVVSSGVMSVNQGMNLTGVGGDISTMLFGSVSGGLSSALTGGNFWKGAAIGLTVSGLNHVAHKIEQSAYNNKVLRDFAEKYFGDTEEFKRSTYTTRAPRGKFKNDEGFFEDKKSGTTSWGSTNPKTGKVHVSRAAYEDSFARFYITVGHETIHSVFRKLGLSYNANVDHATITDWMIQQANVFGDQSLISDIQDYAAPFQQYIGIKPEVNWGKTGIIVRTQF